MNRETTQSTTPSTNLESTVGADAMQKRATITLAFTLLFATLAFAFPRVANAQELQLETSVTTEYAPDPSYDAVSDANFNGAPTLKAALTLDKLLVFDGLRAYIEMNATGRTQSRFDGAYDFRWSRGMYLLGADWGPTIYGFMRPFVRVTAGYSLQRLAVTPEGSSGPFSQRQHEFATKDSIGLELHLPYKKDGDSSSGIPTLSDSFTLGVSSQIGVIWQTPSRYDNLRRSGNPFGDEDSWNRSGMDLGQLNSTGLFWDVGAFARIKF